MCTGAEIGIMMAASMAVSAAGAVYSGVQANQQAKVQSAIMRQQAERERLVAEAEEKEFRDRQQRVMASRRALLGGAGIDATTGSPLLAGEDFVGEIELQALKIRNGGEVRATRAEQEANLVRMKGRNDQTAGFIRAGASLLNAGATYYEKKPPTKTGTGPP